MTNTLSRCSAALLIFALAGRSAWAQTPLIPPAAPLLSGQVSASPPSPAAAERAAGDQLSSVLLNPILSVPLSLPSLPELTLAAPPALPQTALPQTARRVPAPPARLQRKPPAAPPLRVTEQQIVYGRSAQGRPLTASIMDNGSPAPRNVTLIFGGFHGNERSTSGVVERLLVFLKQTPQAWLHSRVVLVPFANPDGWAQETRVNSHGVDINRNFPAGWQGAARAVRYSPGPHAASEPETQAIIALLEHLHPAKIVSLHSPLHCLNWTGNLGREMALAMHATNHLPVTSDIGYPTPGSLGDYCGAERIGIVTLELGGEDAEAAWQQNRAAFLSVINLRPFPVTQAGIPATGNERTVHADQR